MINAVVSASEDDSFQVSERQGNFGASSVKRSSREDTVDVEAKLRTVTIDGLQLERCNFIKINVEGSEKSVVAGAINTIRRHQPVVFFEVNFIKEAIAVIDKLRCEYYRFFGLVAKAFNPENFLGNDCDVFQGGAECGILAVPNSRYESLHDSIVASRLATIETADDVALMLMNKPQYVGMDITLERAARALSVPGIINGQRIVVLEDLLAEARANLEASSDGLKRVAADNDRLGCELSNVGGENDRLRDRVQAAQRHLNWQQFEIKRLTADNDRLGSEVGWATAESHRLGSELGRATAESHRLGSELGQARALAEMGRVLSRRARKFPFSIYFRVKRKYRKILRALLSGTAPEIVAGVANEVLPSGGVEPEAFPVSAAEFEAPPDSVAEPKVPAVSAAEPEAHPGGHAAESLRHLRVLVPRLSLNLEDLFVGDEPILSSEGISRAISELAETESSRGVILSFSHDHYTTIVGGTQLCVSIEESEGRSEGFVYLHAHPLAFLQSLAPSDIGDLTFLRLTLNGDVLGICSYPALHEAVTLLRSRGAKQHIVVHHLLGHSTEWIGAIIEATGRGRAWMWLHDFFTICPSPHLLRNSVSFCGAPELVSVACGICAYGPARLAHRERMRSLFVGNAFSFLAPSKFVSELWCERSGLPFADLRVVPHLELNWAPQARLSTQTSRPARVAFVGIPALHKGWPAFARLVNEYRDDRRYEFAYFGVHKTELDIAHFSISVSKNNRMEMVDALREAGVDIVFHISPTPETFSFTTHEALASGAYVVTNASSGNTARVIAHTGRGMVLENEKDILAVFADGSITKLAREARERRARESCKTSFSRLTVPFLLAESD